MAMQLAVEQDLLLKLARLFVQSAHPIVIHWLLLERVEVFISYSNQIGDVMDIATWKYAGQNSGMQSINGNNIAIYVSCGGNPFFFTQRYQEQSIYGDGWPAIARLQIIAAQELGIMLIFTAILMLILLADIQLIHLLQRLKLMFYMQGVAIYLDATKFYKTLSV
ncbi:hypothetical protein OTSGILL_1536 [Orientia tsutsugamushi str. Gilliam]|uniref:Uncharacterized protein n=1 Tax=Orientia tsutsugamushi str. Gilliam TaxID=1359184 RepID=A0A0F3MA97_ORITS|nr:hypothetical protein OTSGILL_1536 [Orientia tsutsugamushi str. Gilliam]